MPKAPRPKPLADLRGEMWNGRTNAVEPTPPPGTPEIPDYFKDDPIATKEWNDTAPILAAMKVLTKADKAILELYCKAYSRFRMAEQELKNNGDVATTKTGYRCISPYVTILNKAQDQCRRYLLEMGLTPAARSRMRIEPQEDKPQSLMAFAAKRA